MYAGDFGRGIGFRDRAIDSMARDRDDPVSDVDTEDSEWREERRRPYGSALPSPTSSARLLPAPEPPSAPFVIHAAAGSTVTVVVNSFNRRTLR